MRALATLVFLCFALTHAGAATLFDGPTSSTSNIMVASASELTDSALDADLLDAALQKAESHPSLPCDKCDYGECLFLAPFGIQSAAADYLHAQYLAVSTSDFRHLRIELLKPPKS